MNPLAVAPVEDTPIAPPDRSEDHAYSSKVTSQHYVMVTDAHAIVVGTWGVAGTEWRRTHLRVLLKAEAVATLTWVVGIPDDILQAVEA